jgi:hypothetical protein
MATHVSGPDDSALCRVGGVSAIVLGLSYLAVTGLYATAGAVPSGTGEDWLAYLDGKDAVWWAIAGLSVLTDVLFLPLAGALYVALRRLNRNAMRAGSTLLVLFVILDLAVTWPNYAAAVTTWPRRPMRSERQSWQRRRIPRRSSIRACLLCMPSSSLPWGSLRSVW